MTKIRFQTVPNPDGSLALRRTESGDCQGAVETVLNFVPGEEELAKEVTAMLNAYRVRKDFDEHRINSMLGVQDSDLPRRTGDEHAAVLPVLRELAAKVSKAVLAWTAYADHLWALLTPPEPVYVPHVGSVRGAWRSNLSHSSSYERQEQMPEGAAGVLLDADLEAVRKLYGHAMVNVRAYEVYLEEIQKRIDQEFGHLPQPPEDGPARQGSKQDRNIYLHLDGGEIGGEFLGVAFNPHRAALIKDALNEYFANHPEEMEHN